MVKTSFWRETMNQEETRAWVEMHEFPNRIKVFRSGHVDFDGKPIPTRIVLYYQPGEGTKTRPDEENPDKLRMFGQYMDEQGSTYWVSLSDADYFAQRISGYSRARL